MRRAPKFCPTRTVVAMPKPNTAAIIKNMMMLTLAVAASALSPISLPTQMELMVPFSVCSRLEISVGIEKGQQCGQDRPLRQIAAHGRTGTVMRRATVGGGWALLACRSCPSGVARQVNMQAVCQRIAMGEANVASQRIRACRVAASRPSGISQMRCEGWRAPGPAHAPARHHRAWRSRI
jgi:hypothetical protein